MNINNEIITKNVCLRIYKLPIDVTNPQLLINTNNTQLLIDETYKEFISILNSFEGNGEGFVHIFRGYGNPVAINPIAPNSCESYVRKLYVSVALGLLSEFAEDNEVDIMLEEENIYVFISPVCNEYLELVIGEIFI